MRSPARAASGGHYLTSVARIADFADRAFGVEPVGRAGWADGDYVVGELVAGAPFLIEGPNGRPAEMLAGDTLVGALGRRCATLEVVGDWRAVGDELTMETLTSAGVLGRCTSASHPPPRMATVAYRGHATRGGAPLRMRDFVAPPPDADLRAPVVLIIGTSMDAGKTVAATVIVRELVALGLRVAGAKLTGVGRFRDALAVSDAGAETIIDFVDAGLPSTAVPEDGYAEALRWMLATLGAAGPDVVVAEAGASPLEPYNGAAALGILGARRRFTVLCASDPYAVAGVTTAFGVVPDLVSGRATSTDAAVDLLARLCPAPALNLLDPASRPPLRALLAARLGIGAQQGAGLTDPLPRGPA